MKAQQRRLRIAGGYLGEGRALLSGGIIPNLSREMSTRESCISRLSREETPSSSSAGGGGSPAHVQQPPCGALHPTRKTLWGRCFFHLFPCFLSGTRSVCITQRRRSLRCAVPALAVASIPSHSPPHVPGWVSPGAAGAPQHLCTTPRGSSLSPFHPMEGALEAARASPCSPGAAALPCRGGSERRDSLGRRFHFPVSSADRLWIFLPPQSAVGAA